MKRCKKCRSNDLLLLFFFFFGSCFFTPSAWLLQNRDSIEAWQFSNNTGKDDNHRWKPYKNKNLAKFEIKLLRRFSQYFLIFWASSALPTFSMWRADIQRIAFPCQRGDINSLPCNKPHIVNPYHNAISEFAKWFSECLWAPFFKKCCYSSIAATLNNDQTDFV